MTPANWIQILALVVTLLLFLLPIIYYAGKLVGKFETIITRLSALETKVTNFQDSCFTLTQAKERMTQTDQVQKAMWERIDRVKRVVMKLCFKAGVNPDEE
jgi:hypothetical protein